MNPGAPHAAGLKREGKTIPEVGNAIVANPLRALRVNIRLEYNQAQKLRSFWILHIFRVLRVADRRRPAIPTKQISMSIARPSQESLTSATTLGNGVCMPWLGLGVWQIREDGETERVVRTAIEQGYRSIDTATIYGNERGVGQAIRNCGVPREQLFITTKVWNDDIRRDNVIGAFEKSLAQLGLEYVDLYLVHWAIAGKIVPAWRAMEELARSERVKAIGVSNHMRPHLDELLGAATIVPVVNQIEFHPYLQSRPLRTFCKAKKIQVEAWSPLMKAGPLLHDPSLVDIAKRHRKSVAQVVLRWDIQSGIVTIPKSANAHRIAENAAIFDFTLSAAEMTAIDSLERNQRTGADPFNVPF
jgi:methylglyoxal/glyoxal reductase